MASTLSTAPSAPPKVGAGLPGSAGKSRASAARSSSVRSSPSGNQQPREAGVHLNALDGEAACLERALYRGNQSVDSLAREPEEVEVPASDARRLRALSTLPRRQAQTLAPRRDRRRPRRRPAVARSAPSVRRGARGATGPHAPHRRREDELIEQLGQPFRVNERSGRPQQSLHGVPARKRGARSARSSRS